LKEGVVTGLTPLKYPPPARNITALCIKT